MRLAEEEEERKRQNQTRIGRKLNRFLSLSLYPFSFLVQKPRNPESNHNNHFTFSSFSLPLLPRNHHHQPLIILRNVQSEGTANE